MCRIHVGQTYLGPHGRERTGGEYTALLRRNGWAVEEVIPTGGMFGVIEAVRI